MNLTVDLPIYKKTYELTSLLIDYVQDFPKQFKFSIGERIIDTSLQLFEFISLANKSSEGEARVKYLNQFLLKFILKEENKPNIIQINNIKQFGYDTRR